MKKQEEEQPMELPIKVYSKAELRQIYNISRETFCKWLTTIEDILPHYDKNCKVLTPAQVKVVFEELGTPTEITEMRKTTAKRV